MSEPSTEPIENDKPEPTGTSAVADDVEAYQSSDQWPTADLTGLEES